MLIFLFSRHEGTGFPAGETTYLRGKDQERGYTQQSFRRGGSAPRSNPLPFYAPFLTEKVPLSCTFYWQMLPLSFTKFRTPLFFSFKLQSIHNLSMEVSNLLLWLIPGDICRARAARKWRVGRSVLQTRLVHVCFMYISNGVCHGITIYIMPSNRWAGNLNKPRTFHLRC